MRTLAGLATARGYAVGPVFIYRGDGDIPVPEYTIELGREGDELLRLRRASVETKKELEKLIEALRARTGRSDVRVFECHLMLLEDAVLTGETERHIFEDRVNAESAVRRTFSHARAQFEKMRDPYFRERVRDFDDLERRLLKCLTGFAVSPSCGLTTPSVVIADDLTPSETVQLPRDFVLGFATNGGSTTSHVALLARALGIPAVTGLGDITSRVEAGETILLDGTNGAVTLRPDAESIRSFGDLIERQKELSEGIGLGRPAGTLKDGGVIRIYANVHPGVPFGGLKEQGVCGIGLYRSEYLWLNRELEPTEDEQFEAYRDAAKFTSSIDGRATLTIRVLDIGGDKVVRGISAKESNPFLGNRSIRYLLSHPQTFKTQLRAILRASVFGRIQILYPMIACVDELKASAEILADVKRELDDAGVAYDRVLPVGAMIEVPSAALNTEAIARHVDFLSVGTNDLIQYTMAADRGNESVANLYQPMNPAILKLMRLIVRAAKSAGVPVSVCGESAEDPVVGLLWAALGIHTLSMSVTYIPVIAKFLSRVTRADLDEYAAFVESLEDDLSAKDIYGQCRTWLKARIFDFESIV